DQRAVMCVHTNRNVSTMIAKLINAAGLALARQESRSRLADSALPLAASVPLCTWYASIVETFVLILSDVNSVLIHARAWRAWPEARPDESIAGPVRGPRRSEQWPCSARATVCPVPKEAEACSSALARAAKP